MNWQITVKPLVKEKNQAFSLMAKLSPHVAKDFFGNDRPRPAGTNPRHGCCGEMIYQNPNIIVIQSLKDGTGDFLEIYAGN